METLLQLLNEPGPMRWALDVIVLPAIAVLLIFNFGYAAWRMLSRNRSILTIRKTPSLKNNLAHVV